MTDDPEVSIMRIPISLPCQVPVVPGTTTGEAAMSRPYPTTELCAVDGWWMVGRAIICTYHLTTCMPEVYKVVDDIPTNDRETKPWADMHRYDQVMAKAGTPWEGRP